MKRIIMIAGPNGSGKTTTASTIPPDQLNIYEFINADEIARGLAPLHPETVALQASKLMIIRLRHLLAQKQSFIFETTASGTNYLKYLKEARETGYELHLTYLWLSSDDLAVKRVAHRVAEGGHHIPEDVIRRRYKLGLKNIIKHYLPLFHSALVLDNSADKQKKIASKNSSNGLLIEDINTWEEILRLAHG